MNPAANPLEALRPLHAAPPPALWPPAPGWWVLAVLLLCLLAVAVVWSWRRYRQYRFRHQVYSEIDRMTDVYSTDNASEYLAGMGILLRRIALRRYPAEQVAALTGTDWLQFLDTTGGAGEFSNGVGQLLEHGPYARHVDAVPAAELAALVRRWARQNLGAAA
jgi:hypothetical protein